MTPDSKETSLRERIADEVRFKKWISSPQKFIDMLVNFALEQRALEAEVAAETLRIDAFSDRVPPTRQRTSYHEKGFQMIFRCWFPWTHVYNWPVRGVQTCSGCGRTRNFKIDFPVNPRFDVPRYEPKVSETAAPKVVRISKRRNGK